MDYCLIWHRRNGDRTFLEARNGESVSDFKKRCESIYPDSVYRKRYITDGDRFC